MDKCIKREMELLSFDAKKAEQHIITTDKYRAGFYKYHTGREWKILKIMICVLIQANLIMRPALILLKII